MVGVSMTRSQENLVKTARDQEDDDSKIGIEANGSTSMSKSTCRRKRPRALEKPDVTAVIGPSRNVLTSHLRRWAIQSLHQSFRRGTLPDRYLPGFPH